MDLELERSASDAGDEQSARVLTPDQRAQKLALAQEMAELVEACLKEERPTLALHSALKERVHQQGYDRQELVEALCVKLDLMSDQGVPDPTEDVVLDCLDALEGWCAPQWRI